MQCRSVGAGVSCMGRRGCRTPSRGVDAFVPLISPLRVGLLRQGARGATLGENAFRTAAPRVLPAWCGL